MRYRSFDFTQSQLPKGLKSILIITAITYILQSFVPKFFNLFSLTPYLVFQKIYLWQMLTYMFLHGSFFHFLLNMLILWLIGREIEMYYGTSQFLKIYILSGFGAGIINSIITPKSLIPIVGSSGAIYGILTWFGLTFPNAIIYLYFIFPIKAKHLIIALAILEFIAGLTGSQPGIANFAHLGGILVAFAYWKIYKKTPLYLNFHYLQILKNKLLFIFKDFQKRISHKFYKILPRRFRKLNPIELEFEVNRILDKILIKGIDSLTSYEKRIMKIYSARKKRNI